MADEQPDAPGPRAQLLHDVVGHLAEVGTSDVSLRELAAAVGTSHRMLLYHFGSKEQLLVAVAQEVERQQQEAMAGLALDRAQSARAVAEAMWARVSDPSLAPNARLFFELYGQALMGRPGTTSLLDGDVDAWVELAAAQLVAFGGDEATARTDARLSLAVVRGLLLDLLATGDRDGVDAAHTRFFELYEQAGAAPRHGA